MKPKPRRPGRRTARGLGCALACALAGAAPAARAEDLLQVYAEARAADPQLAAADAARGVQAETALQARAPLLPQWQLDASDARLQSDGSHARAVDSRIAQALVNIAQLRGWRAERTQTSAADARVRAAEQDLCARVARAYFGVLSAQAALATAEANERAFATEVAQSRHRVDAGLTAEVDVQQGRSYFELARGATEQARQALADARQALAEITGRTPGALSPLAADLPMLPPAPHSVEAWIERALAANPALQAERLVLAASDERVAAARAQRWPTLSAGVETLRSGGAAIDPLLRGRAVTQVSVTLSVPLFDGGLIASQQRQASFRRDAARDALTAAQRALVRNTRAQYQAVLSGIALLQSAHAAVDAADRALAATRTGQTLGVRSNTDLLLAIQNQAQAQNAYQQARHGYVLARLLLLQAAGELDEGRLAEVDRLLEPAARAAAVPGDASASARPSSNPPARGAS
jgi:outer membrane protein